MLIVKVPFYSASYSSTTNQTSSNPEKKKYDTTCNNSQAIPLCRIRYDLDHIRVDLITTP